MVWQTRHTLTMWTSSPTPRCLSKWTESTCTHKNLHGNVYSNIIHNRQKQKHPNVPALVKACTVAHPTWRHAPQQHKGTSYWYAPHGETSNVFRYVNRARPNKAIGTENRSVGGGRSWRQRVIFGVMLTALNLDCGGIRDYAFIKTHRPIHQRVNCTVYKWKRKKNLQW